MKLGFVGRRPLVEEDGAVTTPVRTCWLWARYGDTWIIGAWDQKLGLWRDGSFDNSLLEPDEWVEILPPGKTRITNWDEP